MSDAITPVTALKNVGVAALLTSPAALDLYFKFLPQLLTVTTSIGGLIIIGMTVFKLRRDRVLAEIQRVNAEKDTIIKDEQILALRRTREEHRRAEDKEADL